MRCTSCGALLQEVDRYCEVCDAPNLGGRWAARFRSPLTDLELQARSASRAWGHEAIVLRPDQVPCPRCESAMELRQRWCGACGLDRRGVAAIDNHDPIGDVWTTPGPQAIDVFRPLGFATGVMRGALLAAGSAFAAVATLYGLWFRQLGSAPAANGASAPAIFSPWVSSATAAAGVFSLISLVAAVAWTGRAYRNLAALRVTGLRFSAEVVGIAWLVPGVNLVVPKLVIDEIWRGSDPHCRPGSKGWRRSPAPTALHVGWLALLVSAPIVAITGTTVPLGGDLSVSDVRLRLLLGMAASLGLVLATACLSMVIRDTADRQRDRFSSIGEAVILPLRDRRQRSAERPGPFDHESVLDAGPSDAQHSWPLRRVS